ncbi:hypothetical protein ACFWZ2_13235 [Streptomyces sp. NPDC059002]|uniref:hypothetical protein n=1 Tax=Streptomyces sp. NPDC059002 TaxID=3346690 RepID=UPI003690E16A
MVTTKRIAVAVAGTAAALAATIVPTQAASAHTSEAAPLSCYTQSYESQPGSGSSNAHWPYTGTWAVVSSGCTAIKIKTNYTRTVRVCTPSACNGWKVAKRGEWKTISSPAQPGKQFYVQFENVNVSTGLIEY